MTTQSNTFLKSSSQVQPLTASLSFDRLFALLAAIFIAGLYLDGWAHNHGKVDESFFTPWHAVFYSGYAIVAITLFWQFARNRGAGMPTRTAIPTGYEYSLLGVFVFGFGGVGDMLWHIVFGIEKDVEALFSPSHMTLAVGIMLIASGPFRAAWLRREKLAGWGKLFPVVLSATLFLSLLTFMTQFAHPVVQVRPTETFSSSDSGSDLYVINTNGSGQTRLTQSFLSFNTHPTYSPDGSQILYVAESEPGVESSYEIFLMDNDGTNVRQLTDNDTFEFNPSFSPDGLKIAYVSYVDDNEQIYVMNNDGSDATNLSNGMTKDFYPVWSPDGQHLAFVSIRDGKQDIYLMNKDGSGVVNLTNDEARDFSPTWSPDGTRLAFDSNRTGNVQIHILDLATSKITLLDTGGFAVLPAWSPDGTQIAFASPRTGNDEIYVMNLDGTGLTNITNNPAMLDSFPKWTPDGTQILYRSRTGSFSNDSQELSQALGMAGIILQTAFLVGVMMLILRRWTLPPGTFTLLFSINALGMAFLDDEFRFLIGFLLAGLLADLLYARWQPSFDNSRTLRGFAFTVPFVLYSLYFATLFWTGTVTWSIHFWTGAIVIAGLVGFMTSYIARPIEEKKMA